MEKNKGARGKGVRFHDESAPTLAELGISQAQSHRWQKIAGIPLRKFEEFLGARKQDQKELTSISVLRLANQLHRQMRPEQEIDELYEVLPHSSPAELFSTVVVDPPWDLLVRRPDVLWMLGTDYPHLLQRLPLHRYCFIQLALTLKAHCNIIDR